MFGTVPDAPAKCRKIRRGNSMLTMPDAPIRRSKVMPRLLSIRQATYELGISRTSLYELIATGVLKTVKIGRRRFVTIEAIEEFIAGLSACGGPA
jgi:excisionase family DNA binding protein